MPKKISKKKINLKRSLALQIYHANSYYKKIKLRAQYNKLGGKKYDKPILQSTTTTNNSKRNRRRVSKTNSTKSSTSTLPTNGSAFKVGKKRIKVKSFPRKGSPEFFFSDKTRYRLKEPINCKTKPDVNKIKKSIKTMKPRISTDMTKILKRKKKPKLVNLGYNIELTFQSRNKKSKTTFKTTSYRATDTGIPSSEFKKSSDAVDMMSDAITEAFKGYLDQSGFSNMTFYGLELEVEN